MEHNDDVLVRIANADVDVRWSRNERVTAAIGDKVLTGQAHLTIDTARGSGRFYPDQGTRDIARNWPDLEMGAEIEPLRQVTVRPEADDDWEIQASLLPGGNDARGYFVKVAFMAVQENRPGDAAYIRMLIRGQKVWHMPQSYRQQISEESVRWHGNGHVMSFGRPAILAQLRGDDPFEDIDQSDWLLGFGYRLPRLTDQELRSVRLMIDLLAGNRGQPLLEEGFDMGGNAVWRRQYNRAKFSDGRELIFAPRTYDVPLFDAFERIAGRIHDVMFVRDPPVWLDAVQHQLFAADETTYPEIALAHLGIALDSLIAMAVSQNGPFQRMAMDPREFGARLPRVVEAIRTQYSAFPDAATALINRVCSANDRSVERTRRIFWDDIVRWPSTDERTALFVLRNTVVHHGHIPNAREPGGLRQVERKMREFRNLLVEAYVRYLGFFGEIRDAATPGATIIVPEIAPPTHPTN